MGYKIDLTGQIFGKWTVLEYSEEHSKPRHPKWKCQCSCNNHSIKYVDGSLLRSGQSKSCGCLTSPDLIGQKFGRLTVIEKTNKKVDNDRNILWNCKCSCGNMILVRTSSLNNGNTQSCGCLHKEKVTESNKKYNTYNLNGEYGICYTFKGEEFYFDLEDYDKIKEYCWHCNGGYANAYMQTTGKYFLMHRYLMNVLNDNTVVVDHINLQRNDNRKENLRVCTPQQNCFNVGLGSNNTSGVTGVFWNEQTNKWRSGITVNSKDYYRTFTTLDEAISFRLALEEEYFKEYSYDKPKLDKFKNENLNIEEFFLPIRDNNTSGVRGVSWSNRENKWRAYISKNGKRIERRFKKFDDAVDWRKKIEKEIFGELNLIKK